MSKIPFHDLSRALKEMQPQYLEVMSQVLSGDSLIHGKQVSTLEQKLSEHLGRSVVTCANGSDALEIILEVYEIGVGDEVILSPLTWVSNAEAVIRAGAIPVLAPLDERTGLIDSTRLSSLITKRTKAIIPVHLYGQMVPMQPILDLAEEHQLIIIEDCAQAFGAKQKGELAGTCGHAAAYSFYPTKNLGALGDGGAMAFADPLKAQIAKEIANHGQSKRDVHQRLGRNSRLDTLQAAFLLENLKHFDDWQAKRKSLSDRYRKLLANISTLTLPYIHLNNESNHHLFVIQTAHRDALKLYLNDLGIQTAIHYPKTLDQMPHLKQTTRDLTGGSSICDRILSLPLYPYLKEAEVDQVYEAIRAFFDSSSVR
ncbi:DegT/DnrJ/EryC1/StrS family aminotransferase [Penaeicola halotolerans]|uniref:DegT/DnrJ/EryC1/StrS family aminotransferase n=1 Tax=Penaeicola halotolerans TaxID=2793196 RepID=UPI001CF838D5|nr:DegT/DnrJ/EryC1/StrS family aminotransferase [Penaeicola halotolerans]